MGDDVAPMRDNLAVVAGFSARNMANVVSEVAHAGVELLPCYSLGLNIAGHFSDNLLSELLDDSQTLLDDDNLLRMADYTVVLNEHLFALRSTEVRCAVEVLKSI